MAEAPPTVALLAGHISQRGEVRRLAQLVDRLAHRSVAALVICAGGAADLRELNVPVLEDPWLNRPWLSRIAVRRLLVDESETRISLVHALHDEVAEAAARLSAARAVPLIRTIEDDPPADTSLRLHVPQLTTVVVPDDGLRQRLVDRSFLSESFFQVIPPGIDPAIGARTENDPLASSRLPVIGAIGRFGPSSGFETFLDAIFRIVEAGRDIEFLIGGLGPGEPRLRRRAHRLELTDRLTFAPPAALESAFWRVMTLYVHPATSSTSAPALRSALVAGIPCIATDVPGPRALLADNRGLLVPPADPSRMAAAILELLDQPLLARSLADHAQSWAIPRFNPDHEADALASLYHSVPADRRPR
ncbi:glycosyltransferase family 4 protein [Tautonia marina]|uniref:glycosyltransferase family 4 protein n=1 Tax=Tautonia marina TaxID=2653855 RepID=UPI001375DE5C|nr:glycosyltransferase family 4 protein [Tautonia marina]